MFWLSELLNLLYLDGVHPVPHTSTNSNKDVVLSLLQDILTSEMIIFFSFLFWPLIGFPGEMSVCVFVVYSIHISV